MKAELADDGKRLEQFNADTERIDQFLALARKYTEFTELTPAMVNAFVEKIVVYASSRDEYGDRCQNVEIYLNFIGKFDVPPVELTPEEQAEEEVQRQKRMKNRRKYAKQKERDQKIRVGLIIPGEPYTLTCHGCGQPFQSVSSQAMFCHPNCRARYYRRRKKEAATGSADNAAEPIEERIA